MLIKRGFLRGGNGMGKLWCYLFHKKHWYSTCLLWQEWKCEKCGRLHG